MGQNLSSKTMYLVIHYYKKGIFQVYYFSEQVASKGNSVEATW